MIGQSYEILCPNLGIIPMQGLQRMSPLNTTKFKVDQTNHHFATPESDFVPIVFVGLSRLELR